METNRLHNRVTLSYKYSLFTQRAKIIIIILFLFAAFPASMLHAKNALSKVVEQDSSRLLKDSVKSQPLRYSQKIDGSELTKVIDSNFLNSLIGRMPGATINSGAAGVGSAVRVVWRGYRSVMRSNSMLYALDGIPLQQLEAEQPSFILSDVGQTGDGIAAFSANDIESIYVLSTAAASAMYGSRSAGGVMMINTKKGHPGKIRINVGNSTTFSSPLVMPEFQNTYGMKWGEKIANPQPWNPADFFRTGHTINNSLSVSGGNEFNQTHFSAVTMNGTGLVPNNDVNRYNFSFRNTSSLLRDKLNIDFNLRYIHTNEQNMRAQGGTENPLAPIYLVPDVLQKNPEYNGGIQTDYPYRDYYERYDPELGANAPYWPFGETLGMQNPYWTVNRNMINREKNRWLAGIGLKYDLTSWLDVAARFNYDQDKETGIQKLYATALKPRQMGEYYESEAKSSQLYSDLLLNLHHVWGDFSMNASLGTSFMENKQKCSDMGGGLQVVNQFVLPNFGEGYGFSIKSDYRDRTTSLFMIAQLGYKQSLFLDLGGRMEWLQYRGATPQEYFTEEIYPSAGISVVPTGWMSNNSGSILSYLKLNYTYSEMGNSLIHRLPSNRRTVPPGTFILAMEDLLKPERTKSQEAGLNLSLLNGKVDLDFTMYKTTTSDLLLPFLRTSHSAESNYYGFIYGTKLENKGLEVTLGTNLKLGQVKWNGRLTYSMNKNKIKEINEGGVAANVGDDPRINMLYSNEFRIEAKKGGSVGDLYVKDFERDDNGNVLVDPDTHKIAAAGDAYAGNVNPRYTMGLANSFSWKGLEFDFVIHARVGGVGLSITERYMDSFGVSKAVAMARDYGGVVVSGKKIPAWNYYQVVANGPVTSAYTYDATNVRLAEMSIAYHIPVNKWVNWIQDVRVALVGRNLLMLYNKAPFDPESTASIGTWCQGVDYFRQPSCRNMGFSVNLTF